MRCAVFAGKIFAGLGMLVSSAALQAAACNPGAGEPRAFDAYPDQFRVADIRVGIDFDQNGAAFPDARYVLPPLVVGRADGEAEAVEYVEAFTVYDQDGQALPWRRARSILVEHMPSQLRVNRTFAERELETRNLPNGASLHVPGVLASFLDNDLITQSDQRTLLYKAAFLRLFSDREIAEAIGRPLEDWISDANTAFSTAADGVGFSADLVQGARAASGAQKAAEHGQDAQQVAARVDKRFAGTRLGQSAQALGLLQTAVSAAQAFRDGNTQAIYLAEAYRNADRLALMADVEAVLEAAGADTAMRAGLVAARQEMADYAESVLEQLAAGAREAGGELTKAAASAILTKAATRIHPYGAILGELLALKEEVDELAASAGMLAALETTGARLRERLPGVIEEGEAAGLDATAINVSNLLAFQQRLNFLIADELYSALWTDRFSLSAAGAGKWLTFGAKDFLNPGLQESKETLRDQQLEQIRRRLAIRDNLGSALASLRASYVGPSADSDSGCRTIIAVIDNSGSNTRTDPDNLRAEALRLMLDTAAGDSRVGLVLFADDARVQARPTALGALGSDARTALRDRLDAIGAAGKTDIAAGLGQAGELLGGDGGAVAEDAVVILLSDGQDKSWQGEVDMLPAGTAIHTVALSDAADREGLSRASANTGGIAEIARNATDLHRIIDNLFGAAAGRQMLFTRSGELKTGEQETLDVPVEPGVAGVEFQVTWPGSDIDLRVSGPDGRQISIDEAVRSGVGVEARTYDVIRVDNPTAGTWQVRLEGVDLDAGGEPFTARAHARDPEIRAQWAGNVPVAEVGSPYNIRVRSRGSVTWRRAEVEIEGPDGQRRQTDRTLSSVDAMLGGGDDQTVYSLRPDDPGVYRLRVALHGRTEGGEPVVRMLDRTFRVAAPGQGVQYKHDIDPFIRRMEGTLR